MNLDLSAALAWLTSLDPVAASIVAATVFVVQHLAAKQGANATLGGLLGVLTKLFGGKGAAVTPGPLVPLPDVPKSDGTKPDPLADRPVLRTLRDVLADLLKQRVTAALDAGGDHDEALDLFKRVSEVVKPTEAGQGPFVGKGPVAR